ncbi:hypothetical protein Plhal304r1_c050g0133521 [Plasmopara halstedii]
MSRWAHECKQKTGITVVVGLPNITPDFVAVSYIVIGENAAKLFLKVPRQHYLSILGIPTVGHLQINSQTERAKHAVKVIFKSTCTGIRGGKTALFHTLSLR